MKLRAAMAIAVLVFAPHVYGLEHFSVPNHVVGKFIKKCLKMPTQKEMKSEIKELLEARRTKPAPGWKDRFWSLFGYEPLETLKAESVTLDGMPLENINPYDLEVISRLTMHRDSAHWLWKDDYPVEQKAVDGTIQMTRKCKTRTCIARKIESPVDLTQFAAKPPCKEALCASEKIFGSTKGTIYLWVYLKYGSNLTQYSDVNADPGGFDLETLKAIVLAMQAVPEHLQEVTMKDTGFYRFLKKHKLKSQKSDRVIANAQGAVFDIIDELPFDEKMYVMTHELAHRASALTKNELDESKEWMEATGWNVDDPKKPVNTSKLGFVSLYGRTNPAEDFAETYSLYRFDPKKLKKQSPERYEFMRKQVFKEIEYDRDICNGRTPADDVPPLPERNPRRIK